ncbi:MAG TPA: M28 family peptidase [Thermoanaerobaculia bacterium]|nr:M28 family peptidase [Thermoanaerobaculia bacterium]
MTSSPRTGLIFSLLLTAAVPALAAPDARGIASDLAALGPRADPAVRGRAVEYLLDALRQAGLTAVQAVPAGGGYVNVEGMVPGQTAGEIVLSAHYDSVPGSPGAGDDGSGCGVAIAAASELRRTPLRHSVRVVLFDGEEAGSRGSEAWTRGLGPEASRRILADLNLEMLGWSGSAGAVIDVFPKRMGSKRVLPPGWLVHAVERSGDAVGWRYSVADNRYPFLTQLLLRAANVNFGADSGTFLRRGIPAVTLSDSSLSDLDPAYHRQADVAARLDARRLESWTQATAAAVRRLDVLAGRPLFEDQYLGVFGHVWLRRDLIWIGFLLWVLLVFRGRPGRWRGATTEERRRRMRSYLPGFLFRGLLVLALFLAPVFAVLLWPAALLSLTPPRRLGWRALWIVVGCLPLLGLLATLGVAMSHGLVLTAHGFQGGAAAAVLIPAALAAYVVSIVSRRGPSLRGNEPREPVPQAPSADPAR